MLTSTITPRDLYHLAMCMRDADRAEVAAASGLSPYDVLIAGVRNSDECFVYTDHIGDPIFIVGVGGVEGGFGGIWLLGTDGILRHKRKLHKLAAEVIAKWHQRWPTLGNIVDARNTVHIRWLRAMGFQFGEPIIAGVAQIPFIPFHRTQSIV